jgi:hypothetical protein
MEFKLKEFLTFDDVATILELQELNIEGNRARMSKACLIKLISVCTGIAQDVISKLPATDITPLIEPCMKLYTNSFLSVEDKKK